MSVREPSEKDERHRYMREYDRERRSRARRLFHWSLDMPPEPDDMDVHVNKSGFGWKELAVIGATVLGGSAMWMQGRDASPSPAAVAPVDSEYEVRFYDADGNVIQVPRRPQ